MSHSDASVLTDEDTFSVSEFIKTVNQVVKKRFGGGVWVQGEIQELKIPNHVYFTLVEQ
ncbi:MAG: exodeoxyribonuclease VII large subunit, partial [Actinomycetota bacterium]